MEQFPNQFCYWHIKTGTNPEGTDCSAYLHKDRCFKCPYIFDDLQYDKLSGRIYLSMIKNGSANNICRDFKLAENINKINLISRLADKKNCRKKLENN